MCVDYKDLNKACPKDSYPLPNIDRLVDGAAGHKILSFLDAYSGYNQISMHHSDRGKTAFTTDDANYFYKVMSFDLKNAGATYQRLMDKIFKGMIGRSVEVYVDDIVVKSDSCGQHIKGLQEVFDALRRVNMRLNPEKCAFGVEGGKFLGFMLTHRGIEANPDKCKVITKMRSPKNLKEIQQLLGRLTALSRFVPRLAERIRPIATMLRKTSKFSWNEECEQIFGQLKVPVIAGLYQKASSGPTHRSLPGRIRGSGQRRPYPRSGPRRTPSILRQPDAPRSRDQVPNDRESGTSPGADREEDAPILPKPRNQGKDQLSYIQNFI